MTTKENLQQLLDFFDDEPEKWIQGNYYNNKGGFCLVGRVLYSISGNERMGLYNALFEAAFGRRTCIAKAQLVAWNDEPDRTFPEVKALIEKALAHEQ